LETPLTARRRIPALLVAALCALARFEAPRASMAPVAPSAGFAVRMVKLSGNPAADATWEHIKFCRSLGFNAVWVYSYEAGAWSKQRAPDGPRLTPEFLRVARWCRENGMDLWVSINPVEDSGGQYVFTDPDAERRLLAFVAKLNKKAGVHRIVLSFDDQPTALADLADVFRYGASAAPAHLDLARRIAAGLPRGVALWLCASAYCDQHLGDGQGPYSKPFLAGLSALPKEIGIVWTGPKVVSPTVTVADLTATRARLGGRPLLLYDNFPMNETDDAENDVMALILGALRGREPGIRDLVAAYLACPQRPVAGSRLSLLTSADFLSDPVGYAPDASVARAITRLAGADRDARTALETQQLEWGGPIAGRNYWPRSSMNPLATAHRLKDPAFVDSFTWTEARYPDRIEALWKLDDAAFRDDLILVMQRRLAVARAMPLVIEYEDRARHGRADAAEMLARIAGERSFWSDAPDALRILDLFLDEAGIPKPATP
jgi:hypothetical protein